LVWSRYKKTAKGKPVTIPFFWVFDFDRCLARPYILRDIYEQVIQGCTGITPAQVMAARRQIGASNFVTEEYVRQQLNVRLGEGETEAAINRIFLEFHLHASQHLNACEPFLHELMGQLEAKHVSFGILTAGHWRWQRAKLAAVGLDSVPHKIIPPAQAKGKLIAGWKAKDGNYDLPPELAGQRGVRARRLAFIDDNPANFIDLPSDVLAMHAIYDPEVEGTVPRGRAVGSLREAWEYVIGENDNL
jgi:hypothetical protein